MTVRRPAIVDDKSGDFISYEGGVVGPVEHGRVKVPVLVHTYKDHPTAWVFFVFTAKQCIPAPMGIVPSAVKASP